MNLPKGPKLLIVAHPDDDYIFAHNLLTQVDGPWTIVCSTNPEYGRDKQFKDACQVYGCSGIMLDFEDNPSIPTPLTSLTPRLNLITAAEAPVVIFSHNRYGEYGHPQHIQCYRAARNLSDTLGTPHYVFAHNDPREVDLWVTSTIKASSPVRGIYHTEESVIQWFDLYREGFICEA